MRRAGAVLCLVIKMVLSMCLPCKTTSFMTSIVATKSLHPDFMFEFIFFSMIRNIRKRCKLHCARNLLIFYADGRLVLADGVYYAAKSLQGHVIVDICTLTGAQKIAAGNKHAGIMCNDESLEAVSPMFPQNVPIPQTVPIFSSYMLMRANV